MSILYDGLGATNYNMRRNNACEWVGVGCDSDDNVIDIKLGKVKSSIDYVISEVSDQTYTFILCVELLANYGLDGTINRVISQVHFLKNLDLSECTLLDRRVNMCPTV